MIAAVIGIGSNSVRSLLAEVDASGFRRLWRDREGTRLFAGLDADGNLDGDSMDKTVSAGRRMESRERGAEKLAVFATSAARDAANGKVFMAAVEREAGVPLRIISGEEEAELSFLGASGAVKADRCGMIDIGGGSTEIAAGTPQGIELKSQPRRSWTSSSGRVPGWRFRRPGSVPAEPSRRSLRWRSGSPGRTGPTCTAP